MGFAVAVADRWNALIDLSIVSDFAQNTQLSFAMQ